MPGSALTRAGAGALLLAAHSLAAQEPRSAAVLPSPAQQIAAAVLPLPEPLRAGARVLGYREPGRLVELRPGTNTMTCLADDPAEPRFHVACYHNTLEPFMARGRALRAAGLTADQADSVRLGEIRSGTLPLPAGTGLVSLSANAGSWNPATSTVEGGRLLSVIYLPYATPESTGIPATPRRGAPWLMNPGTPKAHVMMSPER
jgi:hypothetical protein